MVFIWKAYAEIPLHINIHSKEKFKGYLWYPICNSVVEDGAYAI